MNSLTITQTKANGIIEGPVSNLIITKLYNIGKDDDEHQTLTVGVDTTDENRPVSTVSGRIRVNSAFINQLEYLAVKFPDLEINADSTYIYFEDPEVERVLLAAGIGDGTGITASDAAGAKANKFTNLFKENTTITKFNEFKYFTIANQGSHYGLFCDATNLEEIDLSEATFIGGWLFRKTSLKTLNAPNLQNINASEAFGNCSKLTSVLNLGLISLIPHLTFSNCRALSNVVLPESCITLVNSCFSWTDNLSDINLQNVESFGPTVFFGSSLSNVSADSMLNAKTIDLLAFCNTKLFGTLSLPKLISLEKQAFEGCKFITKIDSLGKISTIGMREFYGANNLTQARIPYECTTISDSAFYYCTSLSSIVQYNKSIDDYAEGEEPVLNPLSRVSVFGLSCFQNDSLLLLTGDDISGATTIGKSAFQNTLLSGPIDLSNLTTNDIAESAFLNTKITSVTLPSTVTSISYASFYSCTELTTINLSNITLVAGNAFNGCTKLGVGETLDINLGSSVRGGDHFGKTAYKKLILHGNVAACDHRYPAWEGMSLLLYLDTSDFHVPSNTTWGSTYGASQLTTVIIHPNYTTWEWRGMLNLSNLQYCIILSPTPPTLDSSDPASVYFAGNNAGNATIYVVDETAKAAYLADAKWSMIPNLSTKIKTLAELPSGVWTTGLSSQYLNS